MAKKSLQDYEFLRCEDGIYLGRALKNGSISKDARKITDGEIIEILSEFIQDYCLKNQKPLVLEKKGKPFIEAHIIV